MARQRLAGTQVGTSVVADASASSRPQRFSSKDSPDATAKQLNQLSASLTEAQRGADSRNSHSQVFPDLACTVGGLLTIAHGLNARARWRVVDWIPTVDGVACNIVRNSSDNALQSMSSLALRAYSAGSVSIEVF